MKKKNILIFGSLFSLCFTSCSNYENKNKRINLKFKNDEIISLKLGYKKFGSNEEYNVKTLTDVGSIEIIKNIISKSSFYYFLFYFLIRVILMTINF